MRLTHGLASASVLLMLVTAGTAQGATLYMASYTTESLYRIDTDAAPGSQVALVGAFETPGGSPVNYTEGGLAFDSGGSLYGAFAGTTDELYTVNPIDATATLIGPFDPANDTDVSGISFRLQDNALFGVDSRNDALLTIDAGTGAGTLVGDGNMGIVSVGSLAGAAFDPGGTLYMADHTNSNLYRFANLGAGDATADDATFVGDLGALGLDRPTGMTFALDNGEIKLFVVESSSTSTALYVVDLVSFGVDTVVMADSLPLGIGGLAGIVPEPGTLALLSLGGLAVIRRRRRGQ